LLARYILIISQYKMSTIMKNTISVTSIILAALMFMAAGLSGALAQEQPNQQIPYEVIDDATTDKNINQSTAPHKKHHMAIGVNIDPFPTILTAIESGFGLSLQPWFGVDQVKIRLDITHLKIPNDLVATKYFYLNNVNAFLIFIEYSFGKNFDGFVAGAGFGIWQNSVTQRDFKSVNSACHYNLIKESASTVSPYISIEGGYIWKFYENLYIEPCLALDIMLTGQKMSLYGFHYKPLPVAGEITLKFGMYIDL
jgi:hypothetical protein